MRIIHLSDLHIQKHGEIIWGVDTMANLKRAVLLVKEIECVDAIVITGDLSNDGSLDSYRLVDYVFNSFECPVLCCGGNHDLYKLQNCKLNNIKICDQIMVQGYRFIFLNSIITIDGKHDNKGKGLLTNEDLYGLQSSLEEGVPSLVFMHHPPLEIGNWLDLKILKNREVFLETVKGYDCLKAVCYGHIHYAYHKWIDRTCYISAPSVGFGFSTSLPKFTIDEGCEGFNIIDISDNNVIVKTVRLNEGL